MVPDHGKHFSKMTFPMLMPCDVSFYEYVLYCFVQPVFHYIADGGGSVKTFAIVMVPYLQGGDRNIASIYSMIFLGITLIVFAIFEGISKLWTKNGSGEYYT